jgi:hypothetical protein
MVSLQETAGNLNKTVLSEVSHRFGFTPSQAREYMYMTMSEQRAMIERYIGKPHPVVDFTGMSLGDIERKVHEIIKT